MFETTILIAALIVGLYMAWNIGANDVSNAFSTAVGSGAIKFKQAMFLAAIFEFSGAFFAGSEVANTIRGDIIDPSYFSGIPNLFAVGMLCSLLGASVWLNIASFLGKPVSTTHSIIGAVVGFGLVAVGAECVKWKTLGNVAISWVLAPILGGVTSFILYYCVRRFVLQNKHPLRRARFAVPLGLAVTCSVMLYSIFQSLFHHIFKFEMRGFCWSALWFSLVISSLVGVVSWLLLKHHSNPISTPKEQRVKVEQYFAKLQILDACYLSFAHGANDVANAVGPLVGVVQAMAGEISSAGIPAWILALGGVGIVIGLATYGYKVLMQVGTKITEVTPTRGFAAEISAATIVLICSLWGLPVSMTFVLVGAIMGVGLARGFSAIDLGVVRKIFASWIITIPASALCTVVIYLLVQRWI